MGRRLVFTFGRCAASGPIRYCPISSIPSNTKTQARNEVATGLIDDSAVPLAQYNKYVTIHVVDD